MGGVARDERLRIHGVLVYTRLCTALACIPPLFLMCRTWVTWLLSFLIMGIGFLPWLAHRFRPDWFADPLADKVLVVFSFAMTSIVSVIGAVMNVPPVFFFIYSILVVAEAACWWGYAGALASAALGGTLLTVAYAAPRWPYRELSLTISSLNLAWAIVVAYMVQKVLGLWRENRRMALWLRDQQGRVRQINDQLYGWQEVYEALQQTESPHDLLELALREAMRLSGSPLGLAVLRDPYTHGLRAESWQGFALADPERTALRVGDRVLLQSGEGWIEVGEVREAPLRGADPTDVSAAGDMGRLIVARPKGAPYQESDGRWLEMLATFVAALLENRFLRREIGRVQSEAESILQASWTLAALPDPAAAMEMACRHVLSAWNLDEVMIFLYGRENEPGCQVMVYTAQEPPRTTVMPLLGRGLRLLRRFLDAGTSMIFNRRSDWPEIFDLMSWNDVQAVACFPLYVLGHRWGALCLLAKKPNAFPPQAQQNLAIFSGEIAMTLENFYLRQAIEGVGSN